MSDSVHEAAENVPQGAINVAQQVSAQLLDGLRGCMSEGDAIVTHALALAWAAHLATGAMRTLLAGDNLAAFESALADVKAHAEVTSALRRAQYEQSGAGKAVPLG